MQSPNWTSIHMLSAGGDTCIIHVHTDTQTHIEQVLDAEIMTTLKWLLTSPQLASSLQHAESDLQRAVCVCVCVCVLKCGTCIMYVHVYMHVHIYSGI